MNCVNCGGELGPSDSFCGNCGNPRALATRRSFDEEIPEPSLTVSQPVVPQKDIPYEEARGRGRRLLGRHYEGGTSMTQSLESVGPSPFDADTVYLEKTLRHEPMELALDDSVSLRTLAIVLVRAYLAGAILFVVLGIFGVFEAAHGGGETLLYLATAASFVVFWAALLGTKVTEPIGEWRALLQQGLPAELDALDRLLHSLADVEEAASVLSLPVHWPGMPSVFDGGPLLAQ
jgi:hypothetical protein